jgi:hypothetical protein
MSSIAQNYQESATTAPLELPAGNWRLLRRVAAWRRHRNYPIRRRARREALFVWAAEIVRHASARP